MCDRQGSVDPMVNWEKPQLPSLFMAIINRLFGLLSSASIFGWVKLEVIYSSISDSEHVWAKVEVKTGIATSMMSCACMGPGRPVMS